MKKIIITTLIILILIILSYFLFWPKKIFDSSYIKEGGNNDLEIEFNATPIAEDEIGQNFLLTEAGLETENLEEETELINEVSYEIVADNSFDIVKTEASVQENILLSVPFIAQAPLGNWSDPRQQDACEEASVLMAMAWINDEKEPSLLEAEKKIIELADWQQENYGEHRDLHIREVSSRLFGEYFDYENVMIKEVIKAEELIGFLEQGYLILMPSNGQALKNPYFTAPGPERHLLVIIGYDYEKEMFITNDPGTRQGRNFKYPKERLFESIRVYPSGYHEPIIGQEKLVLLVSK